MRNESFISAPQLKRDPLGAPAHPGAVTFEFEDTKPVITDEQLVADIKAVAAKLHVQNVAQRTYRQHGRFSTTAIKKRFGTWNRALVEAGLSIAGHRDLSVTELFENLINVWTALGRQPRKREMLKPLSRWTHHPYSRAFGGWLQAIRAFLEYAKAAEVRDPKSPVSSQLSARGPRDPSLRLKFLVMRRDGFKCKYCGRSPATHASTTLHIDHVIAWVRGGATVAENLQTLCDRCNLGKGTLDVGGA